MSERTRCVFTVITGVAAIVLFGVALPAVIAYVTFLKVERTAYLGIRLDYVYSIYVVFSVGGHRPLRRVDLARTSRSSRRTSRSAADRRCDQSLRALHLRHLRAWPARDCRSAIR